MERVGALVRTSPTWLNFSELVSSSVKWGSCPSMIGCMCGKSSDRVGEEKGMDEPRSHKEKS